MDVLLVLAVDVSRSVDEDEARLQREGYRNAVSDALVVEAIRGGMIGAIGVAYVEWAGAEYQRLVQVRSAFSRCDLVIVEGHDGPQPQRPSAVPVPEGPAAEAFAIREATEADAPAIAALYNPYVAETTITFEEVPVSAQQMAARVGEVQQAGLPWLVLEEGGALRGYAYATRWKPRSAYRFSVESSVYLAMGHTGRGHGRRLYEALFEALRARGVHAVIGGIALPNPASVALHERMGMAPVAQFREVGFKFDRWIDVGYWERLL